MDLAKLAASHGAYGNTVIVAAHVARRQYLETIASHLTDSIAKIRRANGRERIKYKSGGQVIFTSYSNLQSGRHRGAKARLLILDDHEPMLDPSTYAELAQVFDPHEEPLPRIGILP